MRNVKIIGAGSIGCHLSYACRKNNWHVDVVDTDPAALHRFQTETYPNRYGAWDDKIRLHSPDKAPKQNYDLVIIGTPPDSHLPLAMDVLAKNPPKVLLIEKPLCPPDLEGCTDLWQKAQSSETTVLVGYNHNLTTQTQAALNWVKENPMGKLLGISTYVREHWGGIFKAHPWLAGPHDSYLGYWEKGGGATGEHSHAISAWLHFARSFGLKKIVAVNATMRMREEQGAHYDETSFVQVRSECGFVGSVTLDVVTTKVKKQAFLQFEKGNLEWHVNYTPEADAIKAHPNDGQAIEILFPKKRPDDFQPEIDHIGEILDNSKVAETSPIKLEYGLDTMLVIAAAYRANQLGRQISINYEKGYSLAALG